MSAVIEATGSNFLWSVLCFQNESCFKNVTIQRFISNDTLDEVLTSLGYTGETCVIENDDEITSSPNIKEEK